MFRFAISVTALCLFVTSPAAARLLEPWPYTRLFKESDLVVIAKAGSTKPSNDKFSHADWKEIRWVGRDTRFATKAVLKGKPKSESLTVLHFHIAELKSPYLIDGPLIATFKKDREFLLFLKQRKDGRFECISGQIDPVLSVRSTEIPFRSSAELTSKLFRSNAK